MNREIKITVDPDLSDIRVDKFIAATNSDLSRSYIQKIIKEGLVEVNGKVVKQSSIIEEDDLVTMTVPDIALPEIEAEKIDLDIYYEDNDILIVNKPKGMVVHPAPGNYSGTLVNAIMYHCRNNLSGINGIMRPGIVHRIDKNTTGLLVVCKNDAAHRDIAAQLKSHSVTRRYEAICCGVFKESEGIVDAPIGRSSSDRKKMAINRVNGKNAVTHYRVLEKLGEKYSHIECRLETGRTHQIRVHMSSIMHPLLGDDIYGGQRPGFELEGQTLHAGVLGLKLPSTGEYVEFSAKRPDYFEDLLNKLK